jgi:hypothetical protein
MSTVFIYSGWLKNDQFICLLVGEYPIVTANLTVRESIGKYRVCILNVSIREFSKLTKLDIEQFSNSSIDRPFDFLTNGIKPFNINVLFKKNMRLQLIETDYFNNALQHKIITQKDETGSYIISPFAYKLNCSDSSRATNLNGEFIYRRCFLRPNTPDFPDIVEISDFDNTIKNPCAFIQKKYTEIGFFHLYSIGNYFDLRFHDSTWLNNSDVRFMQLANFPKTNSFEISQIIYWELKRILEIDNLGFSINTILINFESFGFSSADGSIDLDWMISTIRIASRSTTIQKFSFNTLEFNDNKKGSNVLFIDMMNKSGNYSTDIYHKLKNRGYGDVFFFFLATNIQ